MWVDKVLPIYSSKTDSDYTRKQILKANESWEANCTPIKVKHI